MNNASITESVPDYLRYTSTTTAPRKTSSNRSRRMRTRRRPKCRVESCPTLAKTKGLCVKHGGGKRCSVKGCRNSTQKEGKCAKHGGIRVCEVENCKKTAQLRNRCAKHGGARLCSHPGCSLTVFRKGKCRNHGVPENTYCIEPNCTSFKVANHRCAAHRKKGNVSDQTSPTQSPVSQENDRLPQGNSQPGIPIVSPPLSHQVVSTQVLAPRQAWQTMAPFAPPLSQPFAGYTNIAHHTAVGIHQPHFQPGVPYATTGEFNVPLATRRNQQGGGLRMNYNEREVQSIGTLFPPNAYTQGQGILPMMQQQVYPIISVPPALPQPNVSSTFVSVSQYVPPSLHIQDQSVKQQPVLQLDPGITIKHPDS